MGTRTGRYVASQGNSEVLARIWGDLVNWDARRKREGGFLLKQMANVKSPQIFDSALGDGCDSIFLAKLGFSVVSNEIDRYFIEVAVKNALKNGVTLKLTSLDWRDLSATLPEASFDIVLCLGNSLTYMLSEYSQKKALKEFYSVIKPGGILIIDERNYQYILDHRSEILADSSFYCSNRYVYCGSAVKVRPTNISDKEVIMEYLHEPTKERAFITMYPFKRGELSDLLVGVGFRIIGTFSDYSSSSNEDADFYQYVCQK